MKNQVEVKGLQGDLLNKVNATYLQEIEEWGNREDKWFFAKICRRDKDLTEENIHIVLNDSLEFVYDMFTTSIDCISDYAVYGSIWIDAFGVPTIQIARYKEVYECDMECIKMPRWSHEEAIK